MDGRWHATALGAALAVVLPGVYTPAFPQEGPDLIVDPNAAAGNWTTGIRYFPEGECAVLEGCVGGSGYRKLLTFRLQTANISQTDLVLGDPNGDPRFEFDACHHHFHLQRFSDYELRDPATGTLAAGRKQGWCLADVLEYLSESWVPSSPTFDSCDFQGLTRGWSDIYYEGFECQWIDVTDVPASSYDLRLTVNSGNVFAEPNTANNTTTVPVAVDDLSGDPDLIVDPGTLAATSRIEMKFVQPDDPALIEGCVGGTGHRKVLSFGSKVANIGRHDLVLGLPGYSPYFQFIPSHGHAHLTDYLRFDLLNAASAVAASGELETLFPADDLPHLSESWVRPARFYFGDGLQRGWATSIPGTGLCEWIDVTDVPNGDYTLRVTVNPAAALPESDTSNNSASAPVTVTEAPGGLPHRPDGWLVPGQPLEVRPVPGSSQEVELLYDTANCPASSYNVYFSGRPVGSYQYDGAVCNLGAAGQAIVAMPDPPPGDLIWFVIVGSSGSTEGGHGYDSAGRTRPLRGFDPAAGQYFCGLTQSVPTADCAAQTASRGGAPSLAPLSSARKPR